MASLFVETALVCRLFMHTTDLLSRIISGFSHVILENCVLCTFKIVVNMRGTLFGIIINERE